MEKKKEIRLQLKISGKTAAQLDELQRLLTSRIGTEISKTAAIEIAIDRILESYKAKRDQARLI